MIPPDGVFDTARYGFRPFPVIPVDYVERKHAATRTAEKLTSTTLPARAQGTPAYPLRINGGWYQLPGNTGCYGADRVGPLPVPGTPVLGEIDAGCTGPAVKHAYSKAGIYRATLTVTDSKGLNGTDVVRITVQ